MCHEGSRRRRVVSFMLRLIYAWYTLNRRLDVPQEPCQELDANPSVTQPIAQSLSQLCSQISVNIFYHLRPWIPCSLQYIPQFWCDCVSPTVSWLMAILQNEKLKSVSEQQLMASWSSYTAVTIADMFHKSRTHSKMKYSKAVFSLSN